MKKRDILGGAAAALLAFSLPVLILLLALESVAFSPAFYRQQFRVLNRPATTGFSEEELLQVTRALWQYFRGQRPTPQLELSRAGGSLPLYDEREVKHLADVRSLFQRGFALRTAAALTSILTAAFVAYRHKAAAPSHLARRPDGIHSHPGLPRPGLASSQHGFQPLVYSFSPVLFQQ